MVGSWGASARSDDEIAAALVDQRAIAKVEGSADVWEDEYSHQSGCYEAYLNEGFAELEGLVSGCRLRTMEGRPLGLRGRYSNGKHSVGYKVGSKSGWVVGRVDS